VIGRRAFLFGSAAGAFAQARRRPNIVFIFADDLGWGDLSCHGHPRIKTPVLDKMAAEGADFHQFTVSSPVCSPSRAAVTTGHFPARYSIHQHFASHQQNAERGMPDWLDPKAPTIPRILKQAGYRTGHFGKWHLTNLDAISLAPPPSAYGYDKSLLWNGPCPCAIDGITEPGDHPKEFAAFGTVAAVSEAIRFIKDSGAQPFFINLWIHETHVPLGATPEDRKPYSDVPEPQQTYFSAVTRADRQVGRILDTLKQLKLDSDTLVVFSSDNGPEVSSRDPKAGTYFSVGSTGGLKGRKRSLLMGGVCTPFIARWPGTVPAGVVDRSTPLAAVDLLPTFCAAANCALPEGYKPDGENILPALTGKRYRRKKPIFWEWRGNHGGDNWPAYGIREGALGLVTNEARTRTELYDLISDRNQTKNLAAERPEQVQGMLAKILDWKQTLPAKPSPDCVMK
jgi:arylsulfatase A-like enzyme